MTTNAPEDVILKDLEGLASLVQELREAVETNRAAGNPYGSIRAQAKQLIGSMLMYEQRVLYDFNMVDEAMDTMRCASRLRYGRE